MMSDSDFAAMRRRASICPSLENQWDPPESYQHWADLHRAARELREALAHASDAMAAIEADRDLTPAARRKRKFELARQHMEQIERLPSMQKARQSVANIQERFQAKIDTVLVRPTADDLSAATLFREIRDKLANLPDERARMSWLQRFGNDPTVSSALLLAPAGLTNLSDWRTAKARPPKAGVPNWPTSNSNAPAMAGGPNWTD